MIKTIQSNRLLIRKVEEPDWAVLYQAVKHPNFPEDLPLKEIIQTKYDAQQWINTSIQDWNKSQRYAWAICLKKNENTQIGQISISERTEDEKWHTAFWISGKYQELGYAKEALMTIVSKLHFKFWAGAAEWNEASNKVLMSCGFKNIGIVPNGYICRGKKIPIVAYEKV